MHAPDGWETKKLGQIFPKIVVGYVGNVNNHYCGISDGVPFYRTLNIRNGVFRHNDLMYVTPDFHKKNKKSQIFNDDILIARVGANLGMVCKVSGLTKEANIANAIIIKANKIANSDFYTAFLLTKQGQDQIFSGAAGGAQGVFNTKLAQKIEVPFPPLTEQHKIAKILSTWDKAIEKLEALIAAKQKRKKALMQQLLTGKKRFAGFEGEWKDTKLKQIFGNTSGTALEEFISDDGDYHFISIGNYSKDGRYIDKFQRITLNDKTSKKLLNKDDFVMVLNDKTSTGEIIGSTIWINEDNKFIYNQRSEKLTPKDSILPAYAWFLLNSARIRKEVFSLSQGGTQIYVNFSSVKEIKLSLPELLEQQKIASVLYAADAEIETHQKQLSALKQQKKGLMQQLLTGKKRVKVDDHV